MPDLAIDVKLKDDVVKRLNPPDCHTLQLPEPAKLDLCLPVGGRLPAIVNVTNAIPDDCSLSFSLLLQLPPFFASLGCLIKVFKLMKPLVDFTSAAQDGNPGKIASAALDLGEAASDVVKCFVAMTTGVPMFVRDLLLLIARLLKCVSQQLKSLAGLMGGLQISIQTAQRAGNKELLDQLSCAHGNAKAQAQAAMGTVDMVAVVLALAEPLMELAPGMPKIALPSLGSAEDAFAVEQAASTMLSIATSIERIAKALPSC